MPSELLIGKGERRETVGEEEVSETVSTVRFCNSSSESQPVQTPKKSHEETVSCYCSASHYSTDEHDSLRDSGTLHHSDSGADLSESSRDLDWERYWTLHGERLIWESWIAKYGSYVDPSYLTENNEQGPAEGEDASFCCQGDGRATDPNRRTSFTGLLDSVRQGESKPVLDDHRRFVDAVKPAEESTPQILVENVRSDIDELLSRRFSDISETAKSLSGRSEDSNLDETDRLRLNVFSRCSGSSAPLSATTDSMTNVTRITLSSSDSSCGVDDSSAKSSSVLSSDSNSSVDQQWQSLWAEHFNEQYYFHYNRFTERHKKKDCSEEVKSDSGLTADDIKVSHELNDIKAEPQHQESIDDVGSIDSVSESEQSQAHLAEGDKSIKKSAQKQRLLSVGYLLQQLKAMSVEPTERIQEEDETLNSMSRPSTMESVRNTEAGKINDLENHAEGEEQGNIENPVEDEEQDNTENPVEDEEQDNAEDDSVNVRHGVKRSHERESDEGCTEKVKSAYQLMGLMFDMEKTEKIRKASIWYKKRFSQIRFQNRILRLQKPPNKHIYFDDDDEVCKDSAPQADNAAPDLDTSGELYHDAAISPSTQGPAEPQRLEMEEFSEKDDSTDDEDQDVFFSAEEDNVSAAGLERRESRGRAQPKRRRKRQLKKKYVVNYPEEMIANPRIKKFWRRRYSLFSRFDEGIRLDTESWYSVTPEKIATNIAERCRCDLVVDAFCGAGGNAIQLAFTCERVIAVDIDPQKIELARHNARVYGVEDRIEFVVGDYLKLAPTLVADVVFLSPPWGGPSYSRQSVFPLASLQPVSGQELLDLTLGVTDNIAFYLPRNVNTQELVECAGPGGCVEVVQNFLDRELVAVTAYFGELVNSLE
ncbi:Trimethylguanosine synthase [Homalodisca vitripennis]|nr:Trimethylguanosine synthase [Homalodisca vitripennis]